MMKKLMMAAAAVGGVVLFAGNALAASDYECRVYAQQQADTYAPTGQGLVAGGLLGAIGGGLIEGATGGNAGTGAAIGGVGGAVVGGAANQQNRQEIYNQAYWSCMNGGPQPAPVYDGPYDSPGGPPAGYGEQWWMQACASKYRSFQWDGPYAGQFKGFDGNWHWCNL
jgi:hypothetical protein